MNDRTKVLAYVKEVKRTENIEEVTNMLLTEKWIALLATSTDGNICYVMGRIG